MRIAPVRMLRTDQAPSCFTSCQISAEAPRMAAFWLWMPLGRSFTLFLKTLIMFSSMYHCVGSKMYFPDLARPPKRKIASGEVIVTASASAYPSNSPVIRNASSAMGSPCDAAVETIAASKLAKGMSRSSEGSVMVAISSKTVRLMPVAET